MVLCKGDTALFFQTDQLQSLLDSLSGRGYKCIGPQVQDGAVIFAEISSAAQLPQGINDEQLPGHYSLNTGNGAKFFDWANEPQAIKPLLFSPREILWRSERSADGAISFNVTEPEAEKLAVIGVRACDIAALKLHDQHFLQQQFADPYYSARRENLFLVAVNCGRPAATCFCHSTGDGPFVEDGADIVLTELQDGFLVEALTEKGRQICAKLPVRKSTDEQRAEADRIRL